MKYILLFLLSFSAFSMSIEKINNLNVKDVYVQICNEIDVPVLEVGHCEVMFPIPDGTPWYQTLISVGKPAKASIENYFTMTYIPRLIQEENDRLAEVARVQDLKQRWRQLENKDGGFPSFRRVFPDESNPALWFATNLMNKDFIAQKMTEIEAMEVIVDAEKAALKTAKEEREAEILALKAMIEDVNNSGKPAWEKKLLKFLIREAK